MAARNSFGYLGSNKLKRAGVKLNLTSDQKKELIKCSNDPIYFCENYVKIRTVDHGRQPFKMYDFQKEMVTMIHEERFSLINCARQIGKSTVLLAYACWGVIFNDDYEIAVLANKGRTSTALLRKFRAMYEDLPPWMQQGATDANKSTMEFENRSMIYCVATSSDSIRGDAVNLVLIDEAAFVKGELWDDFWKSTVPTISSGRTSKLVLISTPNGMNHWYDLVIKAKNGKGFKIYEVYWWSVPWKDEKWKQDEIDRTDPNQFMQEHELEFLGTKDSLIGAQHIKAMEVLQPSRELWEGAFKIYEEPREEGIYIAIVDSAHGVGLDYSVVTIVRVTNNNKFRQVALYRSNSISHTMFPDVIFQILNLYNKPYVIVENNDLGLYVAESLSHDLDYPNLYNPDLISDQGGNYKLGVRTTKLVKRVGCNNLKSLIENNKLEIVNFDTIREFSNFKRTKTGNSYEASHGHDDIVMTLVLLAWATKQINFIELVGLDIISDVDKKNLSDLDEIDSFYSAKLIGTSVDETLDEIDGSLGL